MKTVIRLWFFATLAAASVHAQTQVTFTISGINNTPGAAGYGGGDPMTFTWVLNTPTAPTGVFGSPYISWIKNNSNPSPALFSSVSVTGMTGTWNGMSSTSAVLDDEIVINTNFSSLAFQTYAPTGNLQLFAPDGHAVDYMYVQAIWDGLSLPSTGIADPIAYFAARTGTYSYHPGSFNTNIDVLSEALSINFIPSSLTISATAIPEPATEAVSAGLGALLLVGIVRRRRAAVRQLAE